MFFRVKQHPANPLSSVNLYSKLTFTANLINVCHTFTNLAKLKDRLVQTNLQLDEAILMISADKSQGVRANLQLDDLVEDSLVKASYLLPILTSIIYIYSANSPLTPPHHCCRRSRLTKYLIL